jgi:glycosyltransferase involved in cell wall biosynthesis
MAKKRLLISINSCWNFVNFRAGLIRALIAEGHEVIAVAPSDRYCGEIAAMGCRFLPVKMSGRGTSPFRDAALFMQYVRILRNERPDAFLGYTVKPNVYGSLAAHMVGVPTINNIAGLGTAFMGAGWLNRTVRALYRLALRKSGIVFFQNPDDLELFVGDGLVNKGCARLLPGSGIDLKKFKPDPEPFRSNCGELHFLFIGRLLWAKGVHEFVEAAGLVKQKHSHTRFSIVGILDRSRGGIDKARLDEWVGSGLVEYAGAADDVRPLISAADCIVLPTYYPEGTPRVLLEGAAMGKPLIATDVPGVRQVVEHRSNGFLVAPRNSKALAERMIEFIDMPEADRRQMGRASRAKAEREFDEKIVITRYLEAIGAVSSGS